MGSSMASAIELKPIISKIKLTNAVWSLIILHVTRIVSAASKMKNEFSGSFFSTGPSSSGSSSGVSSTSSSSSSDSSYQGFSISNGPWAMLFKKLLILENPILEHWQDCQQQWQERHSTK